MTQVDARSCQMVAMYRAGNTMQEVGDKFGVSRQRVHQVFVSLGIEATEGGVTARAEAKRQAAADLRDAHCIALRGCSLAQYTELLNIGHQLHRGQSPVRAFIAHRNNAKQRNVPWEFTLWDWWCVWQESGKWDERGLGREKYVMARPGDVGPYSKDNVYITTHSENSKECVARRGGVGKRNDQIFAPAHAGQNKPQACRNGARTSKT